MITEPGPPPRGTDDPPAPGSGPAPTVLIVDLDVLDGATVDRARQLLAAADPRGFTLVDLRTVLFCDSVGLSAIVEVYQRHREAGGVLRLQAVNEQPGLLLRVTGLDAHLLE